MNKKNQIVRYIKNHPTLSQYEIAKHFGISRSYIAWITTTALTENEREKIKKDKAEYYKKRILPMIEKEFSYNEIAKSLNIGTTKLKRIIENDELLSIVISEKKAEKQKREQQLITDWNDGVSIFDLMEKYNIGKTQVRAFTYMSKLRARYGKDRVSLRLDNSKAVLEKYRKYLEYIEQGYSGKEIAKLLGYKSVASMGGSIPRIRALFVRRKV